jgi:hypothetical protein
LDAGDSATIDIDIDIDIHFDGTRDESELSASRPSRDTVDLAGDWRRHGTSAKLNQVIAIGKSARQMV